MARRGAGHFPVYKVPKMLSHPTTLALLDKDDNCAIVLSSDDKDAAAVLAKIAKIEDFLRKLKERHALRFNPQDLIFRSVREAFDIIEREIEATPLTSIAQVPTSNILKATTRVRQIFFPDQLRGAELSMVSNLPMDDSLQLSSTDLRDLGSGTSARSLTQLFFSAAAIVIRQQPRNAKADQVVLAYRIVSNYWRLWGDDLCAG